MYILEIIECTDYGLAAILSILKRILNIFHLVVPILLIISFILGLIKLVLDPEDKNSKLKKSLFTKFSAALIIFFLPYVVQLILNVIPMAASDGNSYTTFSLGSCWKDAEKMQELMDLSEKSTSSTVKSSKARIKLFDDPSKFEVDTTLLSKGGILLIAGHSYEPYCSSFATDNDCNEQTISGYYEPTETRKLVKLIKQELKNQGLEVAIANEIVGGTGDKMNKSFYLESKNNTEAYKKIAESIKKYKYVLEIHFDHSTNHTESGTSITSSGSTPTTIDTQILQAVSKYTNKTTISPAENSYTMKYFDSINIPMTYLKVEYYDNKAAMDKYSQNKSNIAKEIAKVIKNNYGDSAKKVEDTNNKNSKNNQKIIIGDSRTEGMCSSTYCNLCSMDKSIYKTGMGYDWFINSAIKETNTYLNNNKQKNYNIYILLGVNGVGATSSIGNQNALTYYNKIRSLATGTWKNHNIYFVSVNPVIDSMQSNVKNISINTFNNVMKEQIKNSGLNNLKYCDTNSKIQITTANSTDGLHYDCSTYSNIYNILKTCN